MMTETREAGRTVLEPARSLPNQIAHEVAQWPFLVILSASVLLTFVIPPGAVRATPSLAALLDWIIATVPAVHDYVRHSRFPEIASVYFPMMFLLSPLHFVWMWKTMSTTFWDRQFATTPVAAVFRLLAALLLAALAGFMAFMEGGMQLRIIPWNESRIALALAGYVASGGAFFIALAAIAKGVHALTRRIGEMRHG